MATQPSRKRAARKTATGKPARGRKPDEKPVRESRLTISRGDETFTFADRLPLLPLREVVVFPYMTIPLLVGRLPSINAIEKASHLTADDVHSSIREALTDYQKPDDSVVLVIKREF